MTNNSNSQHNNLGKTTAIVILTAMLLTFVSTSSLLYGGSSGGNNSTKGIYGQQYTAPSLNQTKQPAQQKEEVVGGAGADIQVQVLQSGKPDKGDKDKGDKGQKDKKPKQVQNVKIEGIVDVSQVSNATDAAQAYSFTVTSGAFTSKAKQLESTATTDSTATQALKINFNGKLAVTAGDSFTITGVSSTDAYNTVSGSGTFVSQPQGNSGKTFISGKLDSPLVLQETAVEDLS